MVEVFYVVERRHWQTGALVVALLVAAWLVFNGGRRSGAGSGGSQSLVFLPQFQPGEGPAVPAAARPESFPSLESPESAGRAPVTVQPARGGLYDGYRIEREKARAREMEMLEALMGRADLTDQQRQASQERLLKLLDRGEKEAQAEQLLRARGLPDAVVVVSDGGASIVVPLLLSRDEVARVGDVVARVVGMPLERITVMDGAKAP